MWSAVNSLYSYNWPTQHSHGFQEHCIMGVTLHHDMNIQTLDVLRHYRI